MRGKSLDWTHSPGKLNRKHNPLHFSKRDRPKSQSLSALSADLSCLDGGRGLVLIKLENLSSHDAQERDQRKSTGDLLKLELSFLIARLSQSLGCRCRAIPWASYQVDAVPLLTLRSVYLVINFNLIWVVNISVCQTCQPSSTSPTPSRRPPPPPP